VTLASSSTGSCFMPRQYAPARRRTPARRARVPGRGSRRAGAPGQQPTGGHRRRRTGTQAARDRAVALERVRAVGLAVADVVHEVDRRRRRAEHQERRERPSSASRSTERAAGSSGARTRAFLAHCRGRMASRSPGAGAALCIVVTGPGVPRSRRSAHVCLHTLVDGAVLRRPPGGPAAPAGRAGCGPAARRRAARLPDRLLLRPRVPARQPHGPERIRRIRGLDDRHDFTLVCADVASSASTSTSTTRLPQPQGVHPGAVHLPAQGLQGGPAPGDEHPGARPWASASPTTRCRAPSCASSAHPCSRPRSCSPGTSCP
jgi:hypothetical protein